MQFAPHIAPPRADGWATTAELAGPRLQEALELCGSSLGTDRPDIQGQRLVEMVTWCLAVPAAAALLDDAELPDLSPANVLVWIGDEPPGGIATALRRAPATASPVRDQATLVQRFRAELSAHLTPLVESVNVHTKRPRTALWRGARDRVAASIVWVGETTGHRDRSCELARAAVETPVELRMLDLGTHELLLHVREGCCFYYRLPAGTKCFSCPLLDDEARRRLVAPGTA